MNALTVQNHDLLPAPQTLKEAMELATVLASSNMLPKQFQEKPENVLVAMMWSKNIGIPAIQGMQYIAVVNGRPSLYGDGLLAVCMNSGLLLDIKEEFKQEGDNFVAFCTVTRQGKETPVIGTFSVNDAKRAGLWGKAGPWTQYPKRMLKMRARSFALRDAFPDVLSGMASAEEMEDVIDVRPAPAAEAAPAQAEMTETRKMPRRRKAKVEEPVAEVTEEPEQEQPAPQPEPVIETVEAGAEAAANETEPEVAEVNSVQAIFDKLALVKSEKERQKLWFETPTEIRAMPNVRKAFSDAYQRFSGE